MRTTKRVGLDASAKGFITNGGPIFAMAPEILHMPLGRWSTRFVFFFGRIFSSDDMALQGSVKSLDRLGDDKLLWENDREHT